MAMVGVGLAWLMAGQKTSTSSYASRGEEYPLAIVKGDLRRSGPIRIDGNKRYSHFTDGGGSQYKALTDETGHRAGHFVDESGKSFRGFADATGRQYHDLRDEAGQLFDEASGWVSNTWKDLTRSAGKTGETLFGAGQSAAQAGSQLNETILKHFKDQPLVGGALAFAVGAAIGAAIPHTRTEDKVLGAASDDVKKRVSAEASKTIEKAEDIASQVYDKAVSVAGEVRDATRDRGIGKTTSF